MLQMGSRGPQVTKLQGDLNRLLPMELPQLKMDGVFGMKTKARLVAFQGKNPPLRADGVAGPKTQARIQQLLGSVVAAPPVPGVPMPVVPPAPPNAGTSNAVTEMQKVLQEKGLGDKIGDLLNDIESNVIPGAKVVLGTVGRVEDARAIARFWADLYNITRGARGQMLTTFQAFLKADKDAIALYEALSAPTGKAGKFLKGVNEAATWIGYVVTIIECVQHARKGAYGAIVGEVYKFGMGKMVPWAAVVEGIGSLLDGIVPEQTQKNSKVFQVIRACDPIGLGAVGVDSVTTFVMGCVELAINGYKGKPVHLDTLTSRLAPLVARMKQSPARLFVKLGEDSGDALYELCEYGVDWQAILRYTDMELTSWWESVTSSPSPAMGGVRRGTI